MAVLRKPLIEHNQRNVCAFCTSELTSLYAEEVKELLDKDSKVTPNCGATECLKMNPRANYKNGWTVHSKRKSKRGAERSNKASKSASGKSKLKQNKLKLKQTKAKEDKKEDKKPKRKKLKRKQTRSNQQKDETEL